MTPKGPTHPLSLSLPALLVVGTTKFLTWGLTGKLKRNQSFVSVIWQLWQVASKEESEPRNSEVGMNVSHLCSMLHLCLQLNGFLYSSMPVDFMHFVACPTLQTSCFLCLLFFPRLSLVLSTCPNISAESVCDTIFYVEIEMVEATMAMWRWETGIQNFCFLKQSSFFMQSFYGTVSGEKNVPTSSVPEERQSMWTTIKLTGQLYTGQKTPPNFWRVLHSAMGFLHIWSYIYNAVRREKKWQRRKNTESLWSRCL